jgi:hypothetical protein
MEAARCCGGYAPKLQLFIDAGANVKSGACMMSSVSLYDASVVRVMLTAGAWVDAVNARGDTPLHDLCKNYDDLFNDAAIVALLLAAGAAFH